MSRVHKDRFNELGGVKAALNPVANIKVGAMILRDCIKAAGSVEGGLKRYVGATDSESDGGYGNLVLAEYRRLKDVAAGKPVSVFSTAAKPAAATRTEAPTEKPVMIFLPTSKPMVLKALLASNFAGDYTES